MGLGDEDHRSWVSFSSHHINSRFYHHDLWLSLMTSAGCSPGWSGVYPVSPLNSFPSPFVLSSLEESRYARPMSKEFGVRPSCEGHSTFVKYLEFYMGGLPLLPNLPIYLYQYRIMDIYSILRLIIQCSFLALLIKQFQVWPLGTLENPGSLSHPSIHFFFPFLAPQNSPGLSCVFLTRIPESAISQEPFCPLPENELRNQDLDVDVPVAPGASFPLGLISWRDKENTRVHTTLQFVHRFINSSMGHPLYLHDPERELVLTSPTQVHSHCSPVLPSSNSEKPG